jgi:hypothetical protein
MCRVYVICVKAEERPAACQKFQLRAYLPAELTRQTHLGTAIVCRELLLLVLPPHMPPALLIMRSCSVRITHIR